MIDFASLFWETWIIKVKTSSRIIRLRRKEKLK